MSEEDDYSNMDAKRLLFFLRLRDRQIRMSTQGWVRAAKEALDGDPRALRNRVEMAEMGPVTITNGKTEYTFRA